MYQVNRLKPQIKAKWVAALRSGDYKQGYGQLRGGRNFDEFCALGVLCNLHAQEHPEIAALQRDPALYMGMAHSLPREVCEWAFKENGRTRPKVVDGTRLVKIDTLNDERKGFKRIAKLIEEQL